VSGRARRRLTLNGVLHFLQKCREVDTVSNHIFLGVPNYISEETVTEIVDVVLQELEVELIKNDKDNKILVGQKGKWIKYAITTEYPGSMLGRIKKKRIRRKKVQTVHAWHLSSMFIAQRSSVLQSYLTTLCTSIYGTNTGKE
jgi:hypothetical protein